MANIGARIKARRKELGLTLEEVARAVAVTKQTVQKYEAGIITNIPSEKIELLASVLETTPTYLMGWEGSAAAGQSVLPKAQSETKLGAVYFSLAKRMEEAKIQPDDIEFFIELQKRAIEKRKRKP